LTETITRPGLTGLRAPFPAHQISKLPKPTKAQTDKVKQDFKAGVRCKICGTWHHPDVVHLDYVGHAALTDRLLDVDPNWAWEPVPDPAAHGFPVVPGGMWIKLTVEGVSRYGFGCADGKSGGDAIKEVIGDALRNAAMRFGAALDLWHKGDLHVDDAEEVAPAEPARGGPINDLQRAHLMTLAEQAGADMKGFCRFFQITALPALPADRFEQAKAMLEKKLADKAPPANDLDANIPFEDARNG
jgi:hypothetical protein